jgi:hypothetical protein
MACTNGDFIQKLMLPLRDRLINDPNFSKWPAPVLEIDKTIRTTLRCPTSHLDIQNLYDGLLNTNIWPKLAQVQAMGTFAPMPDGLENDEYCRMVGLAVTDPWRGKANPDAVGFRQALQKDPVQAAKDYGFYMTDHIAAYIKKGMTDNVVNKMNEICDEWFPLTECNITERLTYPRIEASFPPGWVKRP